LPSAVAAPPDERTAPLTAIAAGIEHRIAPADRRPDRRPDRLLDVIGEVRLREGAGGVEVVHRCGPEGLRAPRPTPVEIPGGETQECVVVLNRRHGDRSRVVMMRFGLGRRHRLGREAVPGRRRLRLRPLVGLCRLRLCQLRRHRLRRRRLNRGDFSRRGFGFRPACQKDFIIGFGNDWVGRHQHGGFDPSGIGRERRN
jgi:hypothetical protein